MRKLALVAVLALAVAGCKNEATKPAEAARPAVPAVAAPAPAPTPAPAATAKAEPVEPFACPGPPSTCAEVVLHRAEQKAPATATRADAKSAAAPVPMKTGAAPAPSKAPGKSTSAAKKDKG